MQTVADRPEVNMSAPTPSTAALVVDRVRRRWAGMAGRLGLALAVLGFVVVFLGWNGAAGLDRVPGQMPYLLSGGAAGLGLVIMGAALLVAESNRRDRAALERRLEELTTELHRLATATAAVAGNGHSASAPTVARRRPQTAPNIVVAGRTSFHDPSCHLIEGRPEGVRMTREDAAAEGLSPCRVCTP